MPIIAIRSGDIFHADLNPGEQIGGPQIVFGINTQGTNKDAHSVAAQVGRKFDATFQNIPLKELNIGEIYSGSGSLSPPIPVRFHGIVCNQKEASGAHNWTYADLGVKEGLEKLEKGIVTPGFTVRSRQDSVRREITELIAQNKSIGEIKELVDSAYTEIHPPVRIAFIGTGPSGTKNQADWRGILEQMNNSSLSLILYLWNQEVQHQVAQVIQLFPELRASAPLRQVEDMRLAA